MDTFVGVKPGDWLWVKDSSSHWGFRKGDKFIVSSINNGTASLIDKPGNWIPDWFSKEAPIPFVGGCTIRD